MNTQRASLRQVLGALAQMAPRKLWLGGAALAALTVLMGMALLGLSGWFISATALAGLVPVTALVFDVFMPSAGIRLLAVGRTGTRYAERLLTHDATLAALASLRVQLQTAQDDHDLALALRDALLFMRSQSSGAYADKAAQQLQAITPLEILQQLDAQCSLVPC